MKLKYTGRGLNIDTSNLPLEFEAGHGSKLAGVFTMIFSLGFMVFPFFLISSVISKEKFASELIMLIVFFMVGLGIFVGGVAALLYQKKVKIIEDRVMIDIKSIFGQKHFDERLKSYKGVKNYSERHTTRRKNRQTSYTLYINELIHKDDYKKNIKLDIQRNNDSGMRKFWEAHCANLDLPAVSGDDGDEVIRAVEDLDKNIKTLMAEGKIQKEAHGLNRIPNGVSVSVEGGNLKVIMKDTMTIYLIMIAILVFVSVFIYFIINQKGVPGLFSLAGVVLGVFILIPIWGILYHLFSSAYISLTEDTLIAGREWLSGKPTNKYPKQIKYSQIETITVARNKKSNSGLGLLIESDSASLHIAQGQGKARLAWLKNYILSEIDKR